MAAITVPATQMPVAEVVPQATIDRLDILAEKASLMPITTPEEKALADATYTELRSLSKTIETTRELLKKPALEYGRAIDAAAKQMQEVIEPTIRALGGRIQGYLDAENAKIMAAQRAREAEAKRLQAEEDAKAAAAAAFSGADTPVTEHLPARIAEPPPPRLMTSAAVRKTVRKVLSVDDRKLIPDEVAGVPLWILDEKAVERFLRNGVAIPGCRLVDESSVGAKGSRA